MQEYSNNERFNKLERIKQKISGKSNKYFPQKNP